MLSPPAARPVRAGPCPGRRSGGSGGAGLAPPRRCRCPGRAARRERRAPFPGSILSRDLLSQPLPRLDPCRGGGDVTLPSFIKGPEAEAGLRGLFWEPLLGSDGLVRAALTFLPAGAGSGAGRGGQRRPGRGSAAGSGPPFLRRGARLPGRGPLPAAGQVAARLGRPSRRARARPPPSLPPVSPSRRSPAPRPGEARRERPPPAPSPAPSGMRQPRPGALPLGELPG